MRGWVVMVIGLVLSCPTQGQTNFDQFKTLLAKKDTAAQHQLLIEWEKSKPDDPELYTSYFNYYVYKSQQEGLRLDRQPGKGKNLKVYDSTNTVGYIYGETTYNPRYLIPGFDVIEKGIDKFPDRLDMRFGKTHMLGEIKDYDAFTGEIVRTIAYSGVNKNKWLWTLNEPVKDPRNFLLGSIQDYINDLFNQGGDRQAKNIRRIAEEILKLYPDHIISLSNLGISYILEEDYDKALEALLRAEKKSPKDGIVLGNIAYVYTRLKDNNKAIEYYKKVIQYGDEETKSFARDQISKLTQP